MSTTQQTRDYQPVACVSKNATHQPVLAEIATVAAAVWEETKRGLGGVVFKFASKLY